MSVVILLSKLSTEDKILLLFIIFDFNDKGYVLITEIELMLQSVTRAAGKVDISFTPPDGSVIATVAKKSLRHGKFSATSLRKQELVEFACVYDSVRAFLECWRGHTSQVLLGYRQKWQDRDFNSYYSPTICPSQKWADSAENKSIYGMPPASFISWRRRAHIGLDCKTLFFHGERMDRTSEKPQLDGMGCLAEGTLQQGGLCHACLYVMSKVI